MARRFTFRLETVLRLRRRAFEEAQRVVAARLRAIGREQSLVEAARAQIQEQAAQSRAVQSAVRLDVLSVRRHRSYTMYLARCIGEGEQRLARHEAKLAGEREAMVKASVAVKTIEKLKERRRARHLEEMTRAETAEQNDLATQRYRRQAEEAPSASAAGW